MGDLYKYLPLVSKKDKSKKPHVMFFGAVAKPRPSENFDGRIGLWVVQEEGATYKKTTKVKNPGDEKFVPKIMDASTFHAMLKSKLVPAVESILKNKLPDVRKVVIQMDCAGGHGGGNIGDKRELESKLLGIISEEVKGSRASYSFNIQPSSSPDLNVLDLGVWNSICSGVDTVKANDQSTILESLRDNVLHHFWNVWSAQEKLLDTYETRQRVIDSVIKYKGDNQFPIPRSGRSKKEEVLPPEIAFGQMGEDVPGDMEGIQFEEDSEEEEEDFEVESPLCSLM